MPPELVNQGTTAYLTITFLDKAGVAQAPSSASYRIDCLTSGLEIKDDTSLTPASSVEVTLSATDNAIKLEANASERRLVTVTATYGTADAAVGEYEYHVKNLRKVPAPA